MKMAMLTQGEQTYFSLSENVENDDCAYNPGMMKYVTVTLSEVGRSSFKEKNFKQWGLELESFTIRSMNRT